MFADFYLPGRADVSGSASARAKVSLIDAAQGGVATSVCSALSLIQGVHDVVLSRNGQHVYVRFDPTKVQAAQFATAMRAVDCPSERVELLP